ncbi:MAG: winged helix-turn-helix domain-containing protein [Trebonia sp.]
MSRTPELPGARVEASLRHRLTTGEWTVGEQLSTVAVLAVEYNVARGTVASALRALEAEGLVRIVPRWGTFKT